MLEHFRPRPAANNSGGRRIEKRYGSPNSCRRHDLGQLHRARGNLDGGSLALWTSLSYGFDSVPGLRDSAAASSGRARHLSDQLVVDEERASQAGGDADTTFAGVRLRAGTSARSIL